CVTRLRLSRAECRRVAASLESWFSDRSSVVKTCALQALAELTRQDPSLLPRVLDLLRVEGRGGTPAMRARSRVLLEQLETGADLTWVRPKPQARVAARLIGGAVGTADPGRL
ncbi:MAG: hypothetical protein WCE75_05930, partial [Terracidiphilus sp.]